MLTIYLPKISRVFSTNHLLTSDLTKINPNPHNYLTQNVKPQNLTTNFCLTSSSLRIYNLSFARLKSTEFLQSWHSRLPRPHDVKGSYKEGSDRCRWRRKILSKQTLIWAHVLILNLVCWFLIGWYLHNIFMLPLRL